MTWVVGIASMFGYSAALSDIQVSWPGGQTLDCLQKLYPIAPFMVAGFSGSVELGFALISDLYAWLKPQVPNGGAVNTRIVIQLWWRRARWIFGRGRAELQKLGTQLLVAGISPGERRGDLRPRTEVVVLSSSSGFRPRYASPMAPVSIGSGSGVPEYAVALQNLDYLSSAEGSFLGGFAAGVGLHASLALWSNPRPGVSSYLHLGLARLGEAKVLPLRQSKPGPTGLPVDDPMPAVTSSWGEFNRLAQSKGLRASAALA
jgi:hypothetical protein